MVRPIFVYSVLILFTILLVFVGCATLDQGADPLVVHVEQAETLSKASFDIVVTFDDSNRGFWITNAPAFHNFAESLRAPVTIGTNEFPRAIAMIYRVDQAKVAYQSDKSSSNTLLTVFATLTQAKQQADAWITIVKAK